MMARKRRKVAVRADLSAELMEWVDAMVERDIFRSRTHALERVIKMAMEQERYIE